MSANLSAASEFNQRRTEDPKTKAESELRKQEIAPKINHYIPNMLRTIEETLNNIKQSKEKIQEMLQTSEAKQAKEFLDRSNANNKTLNTFTIFFTELKKTAEKNDTSSEFKDKLSSAVKEVFEISRQFYILMLDCRVATIQNYFKLDTNPKITRDILREVLHTIAIQIPDFNSYFKYKTKNKVSDYRAPIKSVSFPETNPENALQALSQHPDFIKSGVKV